jgi:predicted dithiol-disulfide oxidoreductase (DUF899 family)
MFALRHLVCCLRDHNRVFETHWTKRRGSEVMDYNYALMDLTVYGRQESWEPKKHPAGRRSPVAIRLRWLSGVGLLVTRVVSPTDE